MAETNALPSEASITTIRNDIADYLATGVDIADYGALALAEVKRYLEDRRDIMWVMVFDTTGDAYWDNDDSTGRNQDRIQQVLRLLTIAYIFKDYSIKVPADGLWWALFEDFETRALDLLQNARLDVDRDESGEISSDEESEDGQIFLRR